MNFAQENKVFQRPCRSGVLPPVVFTPTVVNYYDCSNFSMAGSLELHVSSRSGSITLSSEFSMRRALQGLAETGRTPKGAFWAPSQSNLSGDTFSIQAPQNLLRTKRVF